MRHLLSKPPLLCGSRSCLLVLLAVTAGGCVTERTVPLVSRGPIGRGAAERGAPDNRGGGHPPPVFSYSNSDGFFFCSPKLKTSPA